jgi:hypothetical protein
MEESFVQLVKSLGVPSALAVAVVYSIWRAFGWLGANVIGPLLKRQMQFFDDMDHAFERQAVAIETLSRAVEQMRNTLHAQEQVLQRALDVSFHAGREKRDAQS